ncbi:MAG TPA: hypothetical protein VE954_31835 [Oligoflexus sp.]|uniref:hypothetical protein n=1 Tax=Oligoflexus sp. TaxID=1971216 RepID=UPI002D69F142|nr:hypothetical protein [Oligoflexus sp.]HYX37716.1 hypothetical protein [Oligoflexus sp.]
MLDRIVREHSYAMSEKVEPGSSAPEPELVLDYDFVRVQMPNRAEKLRRRREEAQSRAREQIDREQQQLAAEASKIDAAFEQAHKAQAVLNQTHAKARNRRDLVHKFVKTLGSPVSDRVDASNTELRKSWTIDDIRRGELMAAELLEIHQAMLSGYDVFPIFLGIRLYLSGQWGRVVGMNHKRCALYFDGAKGQSSVSWDDVIRLFDVTLESKAASTQGPAAYEFPPESPVQ